MSNSNAFLAVVPDAASLQALDAAAKALQAFPGELLGMSSSVSFDPQGATSLHMTFLFFGEYLRALPAAELIAVHAAVEAHVQASLDGDGMVGVADALRFRCFELFPPEKMNLVVARYEATPSLLQLRKRILESCKQLGMSFPSSYFTLIAGEGGWNPHVTLGKIRASRAEIGKASCRGVALHALAPAGPLHPQGLTLLGEQPPRVRCDWRQALAFVPASSQEVDEDDEADGEEDDPFSKDISDKVEWAREVLRNPERMWEVACVKFEEFDTDRNYLMDLSECQAFSTDLAAFMHIDVPNEEKVCAFFHTCTKSNPTGFSQPEFLRFFKGFLHAAVK